MKKTGEVVEIGNNIVIKGEDLGKGLWSSMNRLANSPGLEFTVKARVASIFKELDKLTREYQKEYDAKTESLKWKGEGDDRECLEPEKIKAINEEFNQKSFVIIGRKLKGAQIEKAALTAKDLIVLAPILDDVF